MPEWVASADLRRSVPFRGKCPLRCFPTDFGRYSSDERICAIGNNQTTNCTCNPPSRRSQQRLKMPNENRASPHSNRAHDALTEAGHLTAADTLSNGMLKLRKCGYVRGSCAASVRCGTDVRRCSSTLYVPPHTNRNQPWDSTCECRSPPCFRQESPGKWCRYWWLILSTNTLLFSSPSSSNGALPGCINSRRVVQMQL